MKYTKYKDKLIATNIKTGEVKEFLSVADACKKFGFKHSGVTICLKGYFKQHHGYTFATKAG